MDYMNLRQISRNNRFIDDYDIRLEGQSMDVFTINECLPRNILWDNGTFEIEGDTDKKVDDLLKMLICYRGLEYIIKFAETDLWKIALKLNEDDKGK